MLFSPDTHSQTLTKESHTPYIRDIQLLFSMFNLIYNVIIPKWRLNHNFIIHDYNYNKHYFFFKIFHLFIFLLSGKLISNQLRGSANAKNNQTKTFLICAIVLTGCFIQLNFIQRNSIQQTMKLLF